MKVAGMDVTYLYFPFEMFLDSMARRRLPENRLPVRHLLLLKYHH